MDKGGSRSGPSIRIPKGIRWCCFVGEADSRDSSFNIFH